MRADFLFGGGEIEEDQGFANQEEGAGDQGGGFGDGGGEGDGIGEGRALAGGTQGGGNFAEFVDGAGAGAADGDDHEIGGNWGERGADGAGVLVADDAKDDLGAH